MALLSPKDDGWTSFKEAQAAFVQRYLLFAHVKQQRTNVASVPAGVMPSVTVHQVDATEERRRLGKRPLKLKKTSAAAMVQFFTQRIHAATLRANHRLWCVTHNPAHYGAHWFTVNYFMLELRRQNPLWIAPLPGDAKLTDTQQMHLYECGAPPEHGTAADSLLSLDDFLALYIPPPLAGRTTPARNVHNDNAWTYYMYLLTNLLEHIGVALVSCALQLYYSKPLLLADRPNNLDRFGTFWLAFCADQIFFERLPAEQDTKSATPIELPTKHCALILPHLCPIGNSSARYRVRVQMMLRPPAGDFDKKIIENMEAHVRSPHTAMLRQAFEWHAFVLEDLLQTMVVVRNRAIARCPEFYRTKLTEPKAEKIREPVNDATYGIAYSMLRRTFVERAAADASRFGLNRTAWNHAGDNWRHMATEGATAPSHYHNSTRVLDESAYTRIVKAGLFSPLVSPLQLVFNSPKLIGKYLVWRKSSYKLEVRYGAPVENIENADSGHTLFSLHHINNLNHMGAEIRPYSELRRDRKKSHIWRLFHVVPASMLALTSISSGSGRVTSLNGNSLALEHVRHHAAVPTGKLLHMQDDGMPFMKGNMLLNDNKDTIKRGVNLCPRMVFYTHTDIPMLVFDPLLDGDDPTSNTGSVLISKLREKSGDKTLEANIPFDWLYSTPESDIFAAEWKLPLVNVIAANSVNSVLTKKKSTVNSVQGTVLQQVPDLGMALRFPGMFTMYLVSTTEDWVSAQRINGTEGVRTSAAEAVPLQQYWMIRFEHPGFYKFALDRGGKRSDYHVAIEVVHPPHLVQIPKDAPAGLTGVTKEAFETANAYGLSSVSSTGAVSIEQVQNIRRELVRKLITKAVDYQSKQPPNAWDRIAASGPLDPNQDLLMASTTYPDGQQHLRQTVSISVHVNNPAAPATAVLPAAPAASSTQPEIISAKNMTNMLILSDEMGDAFGGEWIGLLSPGLQMSNPDIMPSSLQGSSPAPPPFGFVASPSSSPFESMFAPPSPDGPFRLPSMEELEAESAAIAKVAQTVDSGVIPEQYGVEALEAFANIPDADEIITLLNSVSQSDLQILDDLMNVVPLNAHLDGLFDGIVETGKAAYKYFTRGQAKKEAIEERRQREEKERKEVIANEELEIVGGFMCVYRSYTFASQWNATEYEMLRSQVEHEVASPTPTPTSALPPPAAPTQPEENNDDEEDDASYEPNEDEDEEEESDDDEDDVEESGSENTDEEEEEEKEEVEDIRERRRRARVVPAKTPAKPKKSAGAPPTRRSERLRRG